MSFPFLPSVFDHVDWSKAGVQKTFASTAGIAGASVGMHPGSSIPNRTSVITNVLDFGALGDDSTDNASAFQSAINATSAGGVCIIPAGIFRTSGGLVMKSGVTVRGAGRNLTTIKMTAQWGAPYFGISGAGYQYNFDGWSVGILSGATAGSNAFTVADASNIAGNGPIVVGEHFIVTELNDPALVSRKSLNGTYRWNGWDASGAERDRGQIVKVTSVVGNVINFDPPLFSDFTRTPCITRSFRGPIVGAGLESVTLYATAIGTPEINVQFINAQNCWLYDVYSDFASQNHVSMYYSLNCTVQHCHFYEAFYHTSGQDNEVGVKLYSTYNLIIDNTAERLHCGIMVDQGAAGNVIADNYIVGSYDYHEAADQGSYRVMQFALNSNHGAHSQFNLFEGNLVDRFIADEFWGTSSHNVLLANFIRGVATSHGPYDAAARGATPGPPYEITTYIRTIDLWRGNSNYVVVGNVIGTSATAGYIFRTINQVENPNRSQSGKYLWSLDFIGNDNNAGGDQDLPDYPEMPLWGPKATEGLVDHGNFDYIHNAQTFDPTITDHSLPLSLFRTSDEILALQGATQRSFDAETAPSRTDTENYNRLKAFRDYNGAPTPPPPAIHHPPLRSARARRYALPAT